LINFIEASIKGDKYKWAKYWKQKGGKVFGIISSYIPEEIIWAGGVFPFRLRGMWKENIELARIYRPENSCDFCTHILESFLRGELDFLDGLIVGDIDQDVIRLVDVILYLKKLNFCHIVHVPFVFTSDIHVQYYANELRKLAEKIEENTRSEIKEENIFRSIELYDKLRNLLSSIYEMRKSDQPPLSGEEFLKLMLTVNAMLKNEAIVELEKILPYLYKRKANLKAIYPRVMVLSEDLDNPAYIELIENEGCVVVMEDMEMGIRYVDTFPFNEAKDPFYLLAKRYLQKHGSARMGTWNKQMENILNWVKEFRIDGVIGLLFSWCYPQQYRAPFLQKKLEEKEIPCMFFDVSYCFSNVAQLKTRIGAFITSLKEKRR